MSPGRLRRRAFIAGLASLPLAFSLWRGIAFEAGGADVAVRELRSLARALWPSESAAAIGRAYLRSRKDESLERELVSALWPSPPLGKAHRAISRDELRNRVAEAVREDFRQRRIVRVRNWHLALTEARLCALVAPPALALLSD